MAMFYPTDTEGNPQIYELEQQGEKKMHDLLIFLAGVIVGMLLLIGTVTASVMYKERRR
jgi:hypothetical protein